MYWYAISGRSREAERCIQTQLGQNYVSSNGSELISWWTTRHQRDIHHAEDLLLLLLCGCKLTNSLSVSVNLPHAGERHSVSVLVFFNVFSLCKINIINININKPHIYTCNHINVSTAGAWRCQWPVASKRWRAQTFGRAGWKLKGRGGGRAPPVRLRQACRKSAARGQRLPSPQTDFNALSLKIYPMWTSTQYCSIKQQTLCVLQQSLSLFKVLCIWKYTRRAL